MYTLLMQCMGHGRSEATELKILCKRTDLSKGLATVTHAVSARSTLAVLNNILITTEDDTIRLSATNLEVAITCTVPAKVDGQGTTTVPAKLLSDFVNALSVGDVELHSLPGDTHGLRIRGGSSEANIRGMDPTEFPAIAQTEISTDATVIEAGELRSMIAMTTFAAATDDARPVFTSVLTRIHNGKITMASADTFRLAVRSASLSSTLTLDDMLIPARSLNELAKILPSDGSVAIYVANDRSKAIFRMPGVEMTTQLLEGQFPNFEAILPKVLTTRVVMQTDQLRAAAKVAALFARNESSTNTVRVTVTPGNEGLTPGVVTLQATSDELGDATGTVDATVDGNEVTILFNIKYLNDVLAIIGTPEVVCELNTPQTPGVIKPLGNDDYIYVIMPLYSRN